MKIYIAYFTDKGRTLCGRLSHKLRDADIYIRKDERLKDWTQKAFENADALVFIGAAGIAVRACAPFLKGKDKDPAVVVCDELGKYAIPVLSGHIGGANALAVNIAKILGALPVITTATDINGVWAVDNWAVDNGFYILDPQNIKFISAALLAGEKVGFVSDIPLPEKLSAQLPENVAVNDTDPKNGIVLTPFSARKNGFEHSLTLVPRCIALGVGCKKNTDISDIYAAFLRLDIYKQAVKYIASIDIKQNEPAIQALCEDTGAECVFYTAQELSKAEGEFEHSDFVKKITGVDNVCERAAALVSDGGGVIAPKTAYNGVTFAARFIKVKL